MGSTTPLGSRSLSISRGRPRPRVVPGTLGGLGGFGCFFVREDDDDDVVDDDDDEDEAAPLLDDASTEGILAVLAGPKYTPAG